MKALKIIGAAIAAILVVIVLMMLVGIPSSFISSAIQARVERETGYRLTIAGWTRISLWPSLSLTVSDITLQDPRDREGAKHVTVGSVQADMTLSSLWSGHPHVTELIITKPVLYVPLLRERNREITPAAKPAKSTGETETVTIDHVRIANGLVIASNQHDRVENRIEAIEADATIDADRKIKLSGAARASGHPLKFDVLATAPAAHVERQNVPVDLRLEAPGLLPGPLLAKAETRLNGSVVMFNGVSGTLGDGGFSGWASVDTASKPLVKVDLDFQQLDIAPPKAEPTQGSQLWSNAPIDLTGLNYVDAQIQLSAADLSVGQSHFAPAAIDATLAGGVLKAAVSNLGAYGGQASGEMIVDATSGNPNYAMHCDLVGVGALPLLTSLADFDKIDGKLQAKIAARSSGASEQAIISNLGGTVFANFQDGAIRGLNVAQMIRNLTAGTLTGWQEGKEQATDLTQLSASFRIDRGQASTTDLNLVGPLVKVTGAGTVDLPTKSLAFRVEPKLVLTTQGQGRSNEPVGFGIPVAIEGPWGDPRIYPDMAGMLDNPDAAYAKLHEMGKGLFGPNGGLSGILGGLSGLGGGGQTGSTNGDSGAGSARSDLLGGQLGQTLGGLIQQGLGGRSRAIAPNSTVPTPAEPKAAPSPQLPQQNDTAAQAQGDQHDSQPMNDVLRQLFNR